MVVTYYFTVFYDAYVWLYSPRALLLFVLEGKHAEEEDSSQESCWMNSGIVSTKHKSLCKGQQIDQCPPPVLLGVILISATSACDSHFLPYKWDPTPENEVQLQQEPSIHVHRADGRFGQLSIPVGTGSQSHDKHRSVFMVCGRRLPTWTPSIPPAGTILHGAQWAHGQRCSRSSQQPPCHDTTDAHAHHVGTTLHNLLSCSWTQKECKKEALQPNSYKYQKIHIYTTHTEAYLHLCACACLIYR